MTDAPESSDSSIRSFTSAGELLRQARERRRLTVKTAAQELHLDAWMLEALENDNFKALGAPVFAKGHLRKYASWLGLSPDDVLVSYYREKDTPETPPLVVSTVTQRASRNPGIKLRPLLGLLVLGAVAAAVFFWFNAPTEQPESVSVAGSDSESLAIPLPEPAIQAGRAESVQSLPTNSVATQEPVPDTPLAPGMGELLMVFNEASWADIRDRDGNRWFEAVVPEGTVETLTGRMPFRVFLGNANGVYIAINGQQFDIAPEDRRNNGTARFTIEAPAGR